MTECDLLGVLAAAAPEDKAEVYRKLGLRLTYDPSRRVVIAEPDTWGNAGAHGSDRPPSPPAGAATRPDLVGQSQCRRADPYSTPTLVLRAELALAG